MLKPWLKDTRGFTLVEMLIVLMIISVLLLVAIPNMTKSNKIVEQKTCEANIRLLNSQVATYKIEHGGQSPADIQTLITEGYVTDISTTCPDGTPLVLTNGKVVKES